MHKQVDARGFTLIELLVVIAIIGMLASIVLASLTSARSKARDSRRLSDLVNIQTALELYANDHGGQYPISNDGVNGPGVWASQCTPWGGLAAASVIPGLVPTYLPSMPADPNMNVAGVHCYLYESGGPEYKMLDYNINTASPGSYPRFSDPARNVGAAWHASGCPSAADAAWAWAVWSPGGICY